MSFVIFPPEINSGLMYAGPGSGSLMAAATAWHELSESLAMSGSSVSSTLSSLQGPWRGPSAQVMMSAMTPYVSWLHGTSAQASQMGAQASAAAGAYETAHSAVVPPPAIAANRARLLTLIATNFFGQNTPAIGATEAEYAEMWAQDGSAMDSYMATQQTNTNSLQKPTQPPQTTSNAGQDQASAMQPQPQSIANDLGSSSTPQPMANSPAPSPAASGTGEVSALSQFAQDISSPLSMASIPLRVGATVGFSILIRMGITMAMAGGAGAGLAGQGGAGGASSIGGFVNERMQGAMSTLAKQFSSATGQVSAKLGKAASTGQLRVPQQWASAVNRAAPVLPDAPIGTPTATPPAGPPQMSTPGGQFGQALMGAMSGRGIGAMAGKAPKMAPKPQSTGGRGG